jgi:hypothetical protein
LQQNCLVMENVREKLNYDKGPILLIGKSTNYFYEPLPEL